jgi:hypothetical protein
LRELLLLFPLLLLLHVLPAALLPPPCSRFS